MSARPHRHPQSVASLVRVLSSTCKTQLLSPRLTHPVRSWPCLLLRPWKERKVGFGARLAGGRSPPGSPAPGWPCFPLQLPEIPARDRSLPWFVCLTATCPSASACTWPSQEGCKAGCEDPRSATCYNEHPPPNFLIIQTQ